jgi:hypothetical protein
MLRERGIELLNENLDALRVDQQVIDDLLDVAEHQAKRRAQGSKPYEANLHDMVLWHFAAQRRPRSVESPIDAGIWVCTLDYGLIGFDHRKRQGRRMPPICLTPAGLIQLVQFWAPRTAELDVALVGSMREPLLFLDFDRGTEDATVRILKALSRFRNVGDLSPPTMYRILANDALRTRIESARGDTSEGAVELVESAVAEEAARLEAQVAALRQERQLTTQDAELRVKRAEGEMSQLRELVSEKHLTVESLRDQVEDLTVAVQQERERKEAEVAAIQRRSELLEQQMRVIEQDQAHAAERRRDYLRVGAVGALALLVCGGLTVGAAAAVFHVWHVHWVAWLASAAALLFAWLLVLESALQGAASLKGFATTRFVKWSRRSLGAGILAILLAIVASAIIAAVSAKHGAPPH